MTAAPGHAATASMRPAASEHAPHQATVGQRGSGSGQHDFDFLHGSWTIRNRRLRHPLTGSTEWYEFDGKSSELPLWDGQANLEQYEATLPDGKPLRGLALRLYDPNMRRWTIHWSNAINGTLDAPMIGSFDEEGIGTFYGYEDYQDRRIFVRFYWTATGAATARWEQAFSVDGGSTWETNWIMEFERTAAVTGAHSAGV